MDAAERESWKFSQIWQIEQWINNDGTVQTTTPQFQMHMVMVENFTGKL
jgi:hypothetical protein